MPSAVLAMSQSGSCCSMLTKAVFTEPAVALSTHRWPPSLGSELLKL